MRPIPASFLAMAVGWGAGFTAYVLWGVFTRGYATDLEFMAIWPAIIGFIAWLLVVVPLVHRFGDYPLLADWRWAWLGWSVLGVGAYALLVLWWMRAVLLVWFPALMGTVAGLIYSLVLSRGPED